MYITRTSVDGLVVHWLGRWTGDSVVASLSIEMGDHLWAGIPPQYFTKLSAGLEMSSSQSAMVLCVWGVKAGMAHSTCG